MEEEDAPDPVIEAEPKKPATGSRPTSRPVAPPVAAAPDASPTIASGTAAHWTAPVATPPPEVIVAKNRKVDFGGATFLSNDDSMSLASAQRMIWALENGRRPMPSEVRPHEVLNYFSFDTAALDDDDLFSVAASAKKVDDDTLALALAVHGAAPPRKPLDLTLVVDVSGSMSTDDRIATVRTGLLRLTDRLAVGDRVDLVAFDDTAETRLRDFVVSESNRAVLRETIADLRPRGGTNLSAGLDEAYRIATARRGVSREHRVLLLTDAQVNQGIVEPATLAEIGRGFDEHGVRLSGVGVGRDFNDQVLDALTEKGRGAYVYLGSDAVTERVFGAGFDALVSTIAHDVRFELDLPDSLAIEKFYGEESSKVAANVQEVHFHAGNTQLFLEDLVVDPKKLDPDDVITLTIQYRDAATDEPATDVFTTTVGAALGADPHNVDKARALMAWTDLVADHALANQPCGDLLDRWDERSAALPDDAEIAFVDSLVEKVCPSPLAYKFRFDSDVPIDAARLDCAGDAQRVALGAGENVAQFRASPGRCRMDIESTVALAAWVTLPVASSDVRCLVRGGRVSCS